MSRPELSREEIESLINKYVADLTAEFPDQLPRSVGLAGYIFMSLCMKEAKNIGKDAEEVCHEMMDGAFRANALRLAKKH